MNETTLRQLLNITRAAAASEKQSQARYARGVKLAVSPAVRAFFRELQREEKGHEVKLKRKYKELEALLKHFTKCRCK